MPTRDVLGKFCDTTGLLLAAIVVAIPSIDTEGMKKKKMKKRRGREKGRFFVTTL